MLRLLRQHSLLVLLFILVEALALASFSVAQGSNSSSLFVGYIDIKNGFCPIDVTTGELDECKIIPFSTTSLQPGFFVTNSTLYFSAYNESDPSSPLLFVEMDLVTGSINNTTLLDTSESASLPVVSSIALSSTGIPVLFLAFYEQQDSFWILTSPISINSLDLFNYPPTTGAFDTSTQTYWIIQNQKFLTCSVNLTSCDDSTLRPDYIDIVTIAYSPSRRHFYGLAQAAQDLLLYSWTSENWDYPSIPLLLVGVIPDVSIEPCSTTTIDDQAGVLTFVSNTTTVNLVTVHLDDASVVSTSPPIGFPLSIFAYAS